VERKKESDVVGKHSTANLSMLIITIIIVPVPAKCHHASAQCGM
jgi:hypothetical protein